MSEMEGALRGWAERRLNGDDSDGHSLTLLAHAIRFAPARQERDEDGLLERAIDRANFDAEDAVEHATATLLRIQRILEQPKGSIGKRKILRECRGAIVGLLTRLRAASGPGDPFALVTRMERELDVEEAARDLPHASNMGDGNPAPKVNPYRNGWTGEATARPSGGGNLPGYTATEDQTKDPHDPPQGPVRDDMKRGGEGAHDWEMVGEGDRYNSSHCCRKCGEYADKEVGNGPCRGEGAPEPDGWITREEAEQVRKDRAAWLSVSVWPYRMEGDGDLPVYIDRLPPEREACSTCTEGQPPYFCRECVHQREEGLREALEREAEARGWFAEVTRPLPEHNGRTGLHCAIAKIADGKEMDAADDEKWIIDEIERHVTDYLRTVHLGTPGPDREAEIRADERRKGDEALSTAARAEKLAWLDAMDEGCPPDVAQGAQHAIEQLLARLCPTDEQESPNRSDEP